MNTRKEPTMIVPSPARAAATPTDRFFHADHLARRRSIAPRRLEVAAELGPDVHRGLVGLVADTSAVSCVDPDSNTLLLRGYPIAQLAEHCDFLDTVALLWTGDLPAPGEHAVFSARERALRRIDSRLETLIRSMSRACHPTDVLRTAISWLGADDPHQGFRSPTAEREKALGLVAALPTIVASDIRRRRGLEPIAPDSQLSYTENMLYMSFGEIPEPAIVHAFEVAMVLYADHGFSASTFATRVTTSTLSDLYSAIVAGISTLKGPLHGGANEAVMAMITDIDGPDNVEPWLARMLAERRTIMGFGHRVYKRRDCRVAPLRAQLEKVATLRDGSDLLATYQVLVSAMLREKGLYPNLDYVAGPLFHLIGFDREVFTSLFAMSRVAGWTAHILEQRASNTLIRPLATYTGPPAARFPPTART
jgi:citrate synthase